MFRVQGFSKAESGTFPRHQLGQCYRASSDAVRCSMPAGPAEGSGEGVPALT
ncbi:MAG TPA: hypothetical protein P5307_20380 [Pirellulaceae bacterium]|nr:hypothetical protein [Pirellulaceae bacterium]